MNAAAPSQFKSTKKAMVIVCRHGHDILHPVTGTKIDEVKRLAADFGVHRGEYTTIDPVDGSEKTYADIVGYFYDLDVDAEAKGWSSDEKEAMRRRLIQAAKDTPDFCQIYEAPVADAPWPTYDSTHHNKIPVLAAELGLVHEAIAYEASHRNSQSVIEGLQSKLASAADAEVEELTAA